MSDEVRLHRAAARSRAMVRKKRFLVHKDRPTAESSDAIGQSSEQYAYLVEFGPIIPWMALPNGTIVDVGPHGLEKLGFAPHELLRADWRSAVHADDHEALQRAWRTANEGDCALDIECRIRLADGHYRWFHLRATPLRGRRGRILRWCGTAEDCDERRCATDRLRASEERYRLATKATDDGSIEDGTLRIDRLTADPPDEIEELLLDLYRRLPPVRITDLLLEVDAELGFTDAFTHLRTGVPCGDRIGLLNVLLAEGLNLGLRKMAEACNTHDYWQLSRIARWHVESEAIDQALAAVVAAQGDLPMARVWGMGTTASADGQFYPAARQGEAMNTVNARYGNDPGIKAYTHVNDRFAPFASRTIPATVSEAPYLLDGLTTNEAGRRIEEQYADTGGFTDHLFGISAMLGYRLVLRIRDLPSKRLYVFDPAATPTELRPLVGGKAREALIVSNWPDLFRCAATMSAGVVAPSRILRKLAAYPRQNDLAAALREAGRIERTLFIIEWILDAGMQRRAQVGLNKGEAHHALKNALRIGRQGEIRDRTTEGQHYRIAGLNLLTAIIVYWNTLHLGHAVDARRRERLDTPDHLLAHVSPLGWAHILLTGEYLWPKDTGA